MTIALRTWVCLAALAGGVFVVSQLVEIPYRSALRGYDNTFNYLWLRSAMVDGDWDFRNDIAECDTLIPEYRASALALPPTDSGLIPNKYGIGWAVLTLPFYVVADAIVAAGRALGLWTLERDGFNGIYQASIQIGHAGLALMALLLACRTIERWIGDRHAAIAGVIAVWIASPLLYYQTVNVSMSHAAAFLLISVLAYSIERATSRESADEDRLASGWWWLAGAAFGLAVVTRFQLVVFGVVIAWISFGGTKRGMRAALMALGAAPFLLLQAWAWKVVYGRWLVFSYGAEGETFHWTRPEWLNSMFSPWHGLFYWHPFVLVALLGALYWAAARRGAAIAWCAAAAATIYMNAAWWCWWFASSFGSRAFDAALFPAMAGAAWLFHRASPRWRTALCVAAVVAGLWNIYLVLLYRTGAISRSEPLTWSEMLDAASRIPEALKF